MLKTFIVLLVSVTLHAEAHAAEFTGKVVAVHDGDTITVLDGKMEVRVRLNGIDAPELGQAFGKASKRALLNLTRGKNIIVASGSTDRYGRILADIRTDEGWVNHTLVATGNAWVYRHYTQNAELLAAETAAREKRAGLWRERRSVPPWEWRSRRRFNR